MSENLFEKSGKRIAPAPANANPAPAKFPTRSIPSDAPRTPLNGPSMDLKPKRQSTLVNLLDTTRRRGFLPSIPSK